MTDAGVLRRPITVGSALAEKMNGIGGTELMKPNTCFEVLGAEVMGIRSKEFRLNG